MTPPLEGLYAITPDWSDTRQLLTTTEAILSAGCKILQYRHKDTSPCHRAEQAGALRALTQVYGARLIINDDVELALAVGADGVHLGTDDGDLSAARARLPAPLWLGASCYQSVNTAQDAIAAGADYVAFGRFFPSTSKPLARQAHPDLLRAARQRLNRPLCAIGGITVDNARPLVTAGADMLAVIGALYDADDPGSQTRSFVRLFNP